MDSIINSNKYILILSILTAIFTLMSPNHIWVGIVVFLIIFIIIVFGEKSILFFAVVSFLTLTSTINISLRAVVQLFNGLALFYLFFKKYGLDFSGYPKVPKEVGILIFFVFLSMVVATAFSHYIFLGFNQIIRTALFFIIIYFIYSLVEENSDVKLLLSAFILVALIYSYTLIHGLAKENFDLIQMNLKQVDKLNNDYINMNGMGAFFIIIIPICLSYLLGQKKGKLKLFLAGFLLITIISLFITNSRAAVLGVLLGSFFILYNLNRKILKVVFITLAILIPLLFINPISEYIDIYFRLQRLSTGRDVIWSVIFNIIKDNPLLGVGPAATKFYLYPNLTYMIGSPQEQFLAFHYNQIAFGHAHNFYLFFWSDLGLLGLFASLLLPFTYFKLGHITSKRFKYLDKKYYLLTLGLIAGGIGLFIRAIFEWGNLISYGTLAADLPFWLSFIMLIYLYNNSKEKKLKSISTNILYRD